MSNSSMSCGEEPRDEDASERGRGLVARAGRWVRALGWRRVLWLLVKRLVWLVQLSQADPTAWWELLVWVPSAWLWVLGLWKEEGEV